MAAPSVPSSPQARRQRRRRRPHAPNHVLCACAAALLLLLVAPLRVLADIRVVFKGKTLMEGTDKPAGFCPAIPDTGVRGFLVAASPDPNACAPLFIDTAALRPAAAANATAANAAADPPFVVLIRRSPVLAVATTRNGEGDKNQTSDAPLSPAEREYNDGRKPQPQRLSVKQALRLSDGHGGYYRHRHRQLLGPAVQVMEPEPEGKECTFEQKIRNAQAAGAAAAIVFDSVEEPLIRMMSETGGEGITIPAAFVTHHTGVALMNLLAASTPEEPVEVVIDKQDPFPVFSKLNFTLLGLIVALIVIIVVIGAMFLCGNTRMQVAAGHLLPVVLPTLGRRMKDVLPLPDVLALPKVRVGGEGLAKGSSIGSRKELDDALAFFPPTPPASPARKARGFENDVCAICLEGFVVGEVLTLLPCGGRHAFHTGCVTPWLTERARTCPLCKVKIAPSSAPSSAEASLAGDGEGDGEGEGRVGASAAGASPSRAP